MLSEIQKLLKERGAMSVKELALALKSDASALLPMLDLLVRKGRVVKLDLPCKGGCSCCDCADAALRVYYKAVQS